MTFKEDTSRIRKNNVPENMAALRRIAFSRANARTPQKVTVNKGKGQTGIEDRAFLCYS